MEKDSTPRAKRTRRPDTRPAEIMEAAQKLFSTRGFRATSLDRVAEAAGVTKGAIYHYFRGKEDLLLKALNLWMEKDWLPSQAIIEAEPGPASAKLRLIIRHIWGSAIKPELMGMIRLVEGELFPEFPEIMEADQAQEAEVIYSAPDSVQEHYFLIALHSGESMNQVNFDLLNYNLDFFNQYDLNIDKVELTETYNMLAVKTFTDAEGANRYLEIVTDSSEVIFGEIPSTQYRMMIISLDNFSTLTKEMEHIPYFLFYRKHYLNIE